MELPGYANWASGPWDLLSSTEIEIATRGRRNGQTIRGDIAPEVSAQVMLCAHGAIRTRDTRFRRAVLYPLSYVGGDVCANVCETHRLAAEPHDCGAHPRCPRLDERTRDSVAGRALGTCG